MSGTREAGSTSLGAFIAYMEKGLIDQGRRDGVAPDEILATLQREGKAASEITRTAIAGLTDQQFATLVFACNLLSHELEQIRIEHMDGGHPDPTEALIVSTTSSTDMRSISELEKEGRRC